jgi:hypothetical protein
MHSNVEVEQLVEVHESDREIQEENWTLKEALKTIAFWTIALSISVLAMLSTGLMFHLVSILEDLEAPSDSQLVFVPLSLASAVLTIASG